ncbi:MAG TPA: SDR family NAD(P)-dependent oxidoreductase [Acidimicrobiia bacterium]|nr:SDR family NAD(P)-dependent oxidoreductase [Acidimicrobiia bacterium]
MFNVSGAVAVVTGASSGIGRRVAVELAQHGATVVPLARREDRLATLTTELQQSAPDSHYVTCDVSDTTLFADTLGGVEQRHGRIDILINNAAIPEPDGDDLARYRTVMETNYFAVVAGTLTVLPGMRARRRGAIVNVSSDTARAPTPGEAGYAASKAAVSAFTEALSYDVEPDGVFLHVLYPGWVPTEMTQTDTDDAHLPPKMVRRSPEQVARLVVAGLGARRVELDATKLARIAPVARTFFPAAYRRGIRASLR